MAWDHEYESDTFHESDPRLSVGIYMNDDKKGTVNFKGRAEGGYYNYNIHFYATDDSSLTKDSFSDMVEIANYKGVSGSETETGEQDFDVSGLGGDTIYIWYGCYDLHDTSSLDHLADSAQLVSWNVHVITKPVMSDIWNADKYVDANDKTHDDISSHTDQIKIQSQKTGGDDFTIWKVSISGNNKSETLQYTADSEGDYFSNVYGLFDKLSPRTTYTLGCNAYNDAGWAWDEDSTIKIRTRSDAPTVTASVDSRSLNSVTFKFKSNYDLSKVYYKYKYGDSGSWSGELSQDVSGDNKQEGKITIHAEPNTKIFIAVCGTESWDGIRGDYPANNAASANGTTYDIGWVNVEENIVHNANNQGKITFTEVANPSGNKLIFTITDDNDTIYENTITAQTKEIILSQSQWDSIYRRYGKSNSHKYTIRLYTVPDAGYNDSNGQQKGEKSYYREAERTITLTGIQKTTHVGETGPKRAMVYYSVKGVMKHAVVWVGKENKTNRTI